MPNLAAAVALSLALVSASAPAMIDGIEGTTFELQTATGHIVTPDGGSYLMWGYSTNMMLQYPGPTLIVAQNDIIEITLRNAVLDMPVSIVFPGQEGVVAEHVSGPTQQGLLTREALLGGVVKYRFVAARAGTYYYHSGTNVDLQKEMGLLGALIVRPAGFDMMMPMAYEHHMTAYDREHLFLLTEMDAEIHNMVEQGRVAEVDMAKYFPVVWFINGRCAPDTMFASYAEWLPTQPYSAMPMMYPGEKLLLRVIGGDRTIHPFHHHGNHSRVIAINGRVLESAPGAGPDLSTEVFTIQTAPGQTTDAIFEWTGAELGWDIYGHQPGDPLEPHEYAPDHGKPFPTILPEPKDLLFGGFWSGSPFLGGMGDLPPGEGGLNPTGGYTYMWHSHTEKEMVNYDIFPGGLMTMIVIVPPGMPMPDMPMP